METNALFSLAQAIANEIRIQLHPLARSSQIIMGAASEACIICVCVCVRAVTAGRRALLA